MANLDKYESAILNVGKNRYGRRDFLSARRQLSAVIRWRAGLDADTVIGDNVILIILMKMNKQLGIEITTRALEHILIQSFLYRGSNPFERFVMWCLGEYACLKVCDGLVVYDPDVEVPGLEKP